MAVPEGLDQERRKRDMATVTDAGAASCSPPVSIVSHRPAIACPRSSPVLPILGSSGCAAVPPRTPPPTRTSGTQAGDHWTTQRGPVTSNRPPRSSFSTARPDLCWLGGRLPTRTMRPPALVADGRVVPYASIHAAMSTGSKRRRWPHLMYGMRLSWTSRRMWRTSTPSRSATSLIDSSRVGAHLRRSLCGSRCCSSGDDGRAPEPGCPQLGPPPPAVHLPPSHQEPSRTRRALTPDRAQADQCRN